ncbi:MAG: ATP-binding protein [Candidatus Thermoplasmatota archaeon]
MPSNDLLFPLSAIVGQQHLKRALLIAAANPEVGSLLVRGERDAGKRTAVTALTGILPMISAREGCAVHCSPALGQRCPLCADRPAQTLARARTPFVEVPISASDDQLMGSRIDGEPYPGLLAKANSGYLFIDRVNLFGEGQIRKVFEVHEAGVLERHKDRWPSRFVLLATMNDDEGALPSDLLAGFSLCTSVRALGDIEERLEVVKRIESFNISPDDFIRHYVREEDALRARVSNARRLLPRTEIPAEIHRRMERACKPLVIGEVVLHRFSAAVKGSASLNERIWVTAEDLKDVSPLVLDHLRS